MDNSSPPPPPADEPVTPQDRAEVQFKAVRLACMKAVGKMLESNLSKSCLSAAAIAAQIFEEYGVPYAPTVGFCHYPGIEESIPHVWLATGDDNLVTDLTFSHPSRQVMILGSGVGFAEGAIKASYDAAPRFALVKDALPAEVLRVQAANLGQYLNSAPQWMKDKVREVLDKALDGSDKLEINLATLQKFGSMDGPSSVQQS